MTQRLITSMWHKESMSVWNEALIMAIYKKGDKNECSKYSVISVPSSDHKIFSKIILNTPKVYMKENIKDHQS